MATVKNIAIVLALIAGVVYGGLITIDLVSADSETGLELPPADEPPLEYVYLDNARVLAYLGQVEQGLATTETRTLVEKRTGSAGISAENVVEVSASVERQRQSQQVVTQTEADRFFTFLRILRSRASHRRLAQVDAHLTETNTFDDVRARLAEVREGDFIRIQNAHLSLPPFAAVFPFVRHVPYYDGNRLRDPPRPLYAPISERERKDVVAYRSALGANPRLPFIVPTIDTAAAAAPKDGSPTSGAVTFIVPVRYAGLTPESGLLAGAVTIVGKVVYLDERLPSAATEDDPSGGAYIDRQSLASFGHALRRAPGSLLDDLEMARAAVAQQVHEALSIPSPVALVVPIAIYQ